MDQHLFDDLLETLQTKGAAAAIEDLCETLRQQKDYSSLFYALLLKKRHELGVSPVPTGASEDLPREVHAPYEDAIREAARRVGRLYLDEGDIAHAWAYYRMIGEPAAVAEALDQVRPAEGEDVQPLVEIAFHHGVHPRKGFDLLLERYGLCSAITMVSSSEFPQPDVRLYCIQRLVRALHEELFGRLEAEIVRKEGSAPAAKSIRELISGRDWLFEDDFYHVDVSHLGAVVQMSIHLPAGSELELARNLCAYGERLSPRFQYASEPPFENQYRDYGIYLAVLAGEDVEAGLDHFRAKVENGDPETAGTIPAEVLVNLLLRLGRQSEAVSVARRHLAAVDGRQLSCPPLTELCRRANDYRTLAEVAREQGDPVHFMAGLLAARERA